MRTNKNREKILVLEKNTSLNPQNDDFELKNDFLLDLYICRKTSVKVVQVHQKKPDQKKAALIDGIADKG